MPRQTKSPKTAKTKQKKTPTKRKTSLKHDIINTSQVYRAARALKKHFEGVKEKEGKKSLFELEDNVNLQLSLHNIPQADPKKHLIPLSYPLLDADTCEICFFAKDAKLAKKHIANNNIPNIKKVLDLNHLRTKYKEYEARRKLMGSYDLFICDARILLLLPGLLGKVFISAKKFPVPVKYGRNLARQVEKVRNSTVLQISSGSCINVKIGKTSFTEDQITENVVNSIDHIVKKIPEQWKNVKAISLLTSSSVALPIYNTIDESKTEVLDNQQ